MQNIHQWTYIFCFYEGLHFKCTLIAALWTILCDDFHVFLQTENLAFCTFPLHFYWHIYRGLNSIFSKWRKTEEGSRNCTSITVTCVISTSWGCCPNNDYHVTILTYVSCDDKQTIQCMSAWCREVLMGEGNKQPPLCWLPLWVVELGLVAKRCTNIGCLFIICQHNSSTP